MANPVKAGGAKLQGLNRQGMPASYGQNNRSAVTF